LGLAKQVDIVAVRIEIGRPNALIFPVLGADEQTSERVCQDSIKLGIG
jgi:hypothetical protein